MMSDCSLPRLLLDTLGRGDRPECRRECSPQERSPALRVACAGAASSTRSAKRKAPRVGGDAIDGGSMTPRQIATVLAACRNRLAPAQRRARQSVTSRPAFSRDDGERRAESAGARDDDPLEKRSRARALAACADEPARTPRRAASAHAPAGPDRAAGRRRAARCRPRRSSRRCRCKAFGGGATKRYAASLGSERQQPRADRAGWPPRRRRRRARRRPSPIAVDEQRRARRACGPPRHRRPRPGTRRQRSATSFVARAARSLRPRCGAPSSGRRRRSRSRASPSADAAGESASGRPSGAARSTFGPPG